MKKQKEERVAASPVGEKRNKWIGFGVLAAVVLLILGIFYWFTHNYAQEAASSFEAALVKEGAVKKCDTSANGLGPDDKTPRCSAIYEIPASQDAAIGKIKQAASVSGFSLAEEYPAINREDNRFFGDSSSKEGGYFGLQSGKQKLSVTVFGSKEYAPEGPFCSAKSSSDTSKTTMKFQLTLPDWK